jgi:hypothetical protein
MSHFDELLGNLDDLQRTKSGLQKALSTQTRMNRELTDLRGRDARARIVRSAEKLKASVDAQRKPDPLVYSPRPNRSSMRQLPPSPEQRLAAGALTPHQAVKAEALINHVAETRPG